MSSTKRSQTLLHGQYKKQLRYDIFQNAAMLVCNLRGPQKLQPKKLLPSKPSTT
jgi:hypothetical protein